MKALRHLNKYLARYKYLLIWGTILTVLMHIASIVPARLIKQAFDLVQDSVTTYRSSTNAQAQQATYTQMMQGLWLYGGLLLFMASLRALFSFLARQSIMLMGKRIEYALKNEIYAHYQTLPLSFYRRNSTGDLMARISEDVNRVGMYLGPAITFGINAFTVFLLLIPYMLVINARLTLYAALPILLLAVATYYISTFMKQRAEVIQEQLSQLTTWVQESFSGIKVLQAFARENAFTHRFTAECETYKTRALSLTTINAIFFPMVKGIIGLGIVAVVFIGGQEAIQGRSTPGNIAEFVMYLYLLGWPTLSVSWVNSMIQSAAASQQRINDFLREENPIISTKNLQQPIQGHITFRNVSFTYPDSGVQALNAVSFDIAAGQSVAIIGPTGAGKSTLAHLIGRLYDVDAGEITIDGVPIQDYDTPFLRQQLGYVPQDVILFSDTIRNNIAWGKPEATAAQITQAAQRAEVDKDIQKFPQQMETMIGERGATLSGGQKQRIAIARAFIRDPQILLLDDCLSAVDTQTEHRLLHNMKEALQDKTALIISHRVAAAQLADMILVLEAGKLVEQGTHDNLLAHRGIYYALFNHYRFSVVDYKAHNKCL
ncbi:MAG: ABC transporter ATP-binding protein, partial [Bacteroidota bacterium]